VGVKKKLFKHYRKQSLASAFGVKHIRNMNISVNVIVAIFRVNQSEGIRVPLHRSDGRRYVERRRSG
jgi:hypothetical protein